MSSCDRSLILAAWLSVLLPIVLLLLCGFGFFWSQFFDTPGHILVALVSIPSLLTAALFTVFIWAASREERLAWRLAVIGLGFQMLAGIVFLALLVVQSASAADLEQSGGATGGNGVQVR
ncbi:MAG: hypothetical protein KDN05_02765 [Verrucomicrobiae bacterium]|nr:hypothetical protein [Verrucomicrobiae bacterium]MCP5531817.1 hypothetical protein [Akkermansiaceae bacterium]MCP5546201.1 hypothetical protein [Akkermansiaceae bacterium]